MTIVRRFFTFLLILLAPLAGLSAAQNAHKKHAPQGQYLAYVGTYTTKTNSKGIYVFRFDAAVGQAKAVDLAAESADPSFLAIHPDGQHLYAVNEVSEFGGQKSGAVSAFAIDRRTGSLTLLNQVATRGAGPCYVSLDKSDKYYPSLSNSTWFTLVANYDGGSVASFPIRDDGSLGPAASFIQHAGSSVNKERQEAPHAHWVSTSPDNRFALAADLGLDEVLIYRFDATKGTLSPNDPPFVKVNPGAGPRHFAFHPNGKFGYVLNEMDATVTAFSYHSKNGALSVLQTINTLPKDYSGPKEAAELVVHPSGKFLYASNRAGIDTITAFSIDPTRGTLKLAGKTSTQGKTPRNFAIDPSGKFLMAANQESDNIVVYRIDPATGDLTPTGQVLGVPSPVCITFVPAE
jgi:6-phosphogluconolactonase